MKSQNAVPQSTDPVVGHKTFCSPERGYWHEPLRESEAELLWAEADKAEKRRVELMPNEHAAVKMLFEATQRLKDFGWRDAIYCPKDGSSFQVIVAHYSGQWPKGTWSIEEDYDLSPSRPILWKPL